MKTQVELGLLHGVKIVVAYFVVFWVMQFVIFELLTPDVSEIATGQRLILIGLPAIALLLAAMPSVKAQLGRFLVPLVVGLCVLAFWLERSWFIAAASKPTASAGIIFHVSLLRHDMILLILLIAWQERGRTMLLSVGIIAFVDWLLVWQSKLLNPDIIFFVFQDHVLRLIVWMIAGYSMTRLMQQQREQRQALAKAHAKQLEANTKLATFASTVESLSVTRERNRLARELHDTLAHSLSAASVQIEAVKSLWAVNDAAARTMLGSVDETVRSGLEEARRSLQALRASPLEELGLLDALRNSAESAAKRADLTLHLTLPDYIPPLPTYVEQTFYRIGQEALENIVRHARAKTLSLHLATDGQRLHLTIQDDGQGFDRSAPAFDHQLGVRGMRERAALIGGQFSLESGPEQGTTVFLTVDLNKAGEA